MSDFPKILTLNREARTRIALGMKSDLYMRCRPLATTHSFTHDEVVVEHESEESWSATRDRLLAQLDSDKPILILCENDLRALRVASDGTPLGRRFRGWKKIEGMLRDCGVEYFADNFVTYAGTMTGRMSMWNIQQFPQAWLYEKGAHKFMRTWKAADDMLDVCGISFRRTKPKFTIKDALAIKKHKQEERNEALKKFNPDPTKKRKR